MKKKAEILAQENLTSRFDLSDVSGTSLVSLRSERPHGLGKRTHRCRAVTPESREENPY